METPGKSKLAGIRFSFDTLFIFYFDVCVGIEENLVLNQEIIFRLLQYVKSVLKRRVQFHLIASLTARARGKVRSLSKSS